VNYANIISLLFILYPNFVHHWDEPSREFVSSFCISLYNS
jgi:hypothetical protein